MKKKLSLFLSVIIGLAVVLMPFNTDTVHAMNGVTVINDSITGYYGTMELVYNNSVSTKYIISEYNNPEYTLEYVKSTDGSINSVLINNIIYDIDDFQAMSVAQTEDLYNSSRTYILGTSNQKTILDYSNDFEGEVNTVDYVAINTRLKEENKVNHEEHSLTSALTRCNGCGQYSPYSPPTTGYYDYPTTGMIDKAIYRKVNVSLTSSAISQLATDFFEGLVERANAVMKFFVGFSAGDLVGKILDGDYRFIQTYHPVCYSAYAEKRNMYLVEYDGNRVYSPNMFEFYFYRYNPF